MKKTIMFIILFNLFFLSSNADEQKDCSTYKKMLEKIKCKADNLKKGSFFKDTIEYQKKAFDKKNND